MLLGSWETFPGKKGFFQGGEFFNKMIRKPLSDEIRPCRVLIRAGPQPQS